MPGPHFLVVAYLLEPY